MRRILARTRPLPAPASSGAARILFVNLGEDWIRGSEQVLLDLIRSLDRRRFQPVVWCNAPMLAETCREIGVPVHLGRFGFFRPGAGPLDPRRYASYVRAGCGIVRRDAIDLIHGNGSATLQFCVPIGVLTRRRVLGHLHSDEDRQSRFLFLTHLADRLVGVSRQTLAGPLRDGMDERRVRVIHNGIDPSRFAASPSDPLADLRQTLGIREDAVVIGTVASLIRRKGHDVLIRAMSAVCERHPLAHLLIAGDGPERPALERLVEELGLRGRIHLLGDTKDPAALYHAADIFALASRSEALALALLEAAHFGLPAVATDVGGAAEAVLDGETGLLVPPEDPGRLAEALLRLCLDPALRQRLGREAQERASRQFSLAGMVAAFEDTYSDMLRPQRALAPAGGGRMAPYLNLLRLRHAARPERPRERRPAQAPTELENDHAGR